jgi:hypothetical protein
MSRVKRGRYITLGIFIAIGLLVYAAWDPVMDWLRVTLHGR